MDDFKLIQVRREDDNDVEVVHNPTSYPVIGRGHHGAVFKISSDKCVKIYVKQKHLLKEIEALTIAQDSPVFPKLYEVGENYIVMEYIEGPTLEQYLASEGQITENITQQILFILQEMKRLNFLRLDASIYHIFVTNQGELRVIDLVSHMKKRFDQPNKLMNGLLKLGLLPAFLEQVNKFDPESYEAWKDFTGWTKSE